MEIIKAKSEILEGPPPDWFEWNADLLYRAASMWVDRNYPEHIEWLRGLKSINVTMPYFWREYVWCSLVSGFNARIVSSFYDQFLAAIGPDPYITNHHIPTIKKVFANEGKIVKILQCADIIKDMGWGDFYARYIEPKDVDILTELPNVGPVIKYHLARNIGIDCIKPDLHLTRLAKHFKYDDPHHMCSELAKTHNVELVGEVDLRLFLYVQHYGTVALDRRAGDSGNRTSEKRATRSNRSSRK
jgi:hypothetical protein